ncbi:hypothetical protein BDZ89DRAFT_1135090 [Hymenopellis radicata]|nr:hypothetical protein BDZ89DRAFT_1135090 [Hymenopellis radicata]
MEPTTINLNITITLDEPFAALLTTLLQTRAPAAQNHPESTAFDAHVPSFMPSPGQVLDNPDEEVPQTPPNPPIQVYHPEYTVPDTGASDFCGPRYFGPLNQEWASASDEAEYYIQHPDEAPPEFFQRLSHLLRTLPHPSSPLLRPSDPMSPLPPLVYGPRTPTPLSLTMDLDVVPTSDPLEQLQQEQASSLKRKRAY